ncbi:hypothetical protein INT47_001674 [Mucor saturninus]|uniref:TOG domain-containing protein n=1 Tax=Mucor saturninus TaxID=64648 RepID=A0A8H7RJV9_9FUNG|nr:hypothetical protein INT47_001674 [Mucor saturninus]
MESIPFEIAHCSSSEQDYEPEHLLESNAGNNSDPFQNVSHRGWQTQRFPEYPQDLILRFKSGLCRISKVQILSHHYKIASRIDLYIGITKEQEHDSMSVQFTRLGFVGLANNDRFQDRELKSIKIQADCEYIRLVIKGCHENKLNIHKQVGLLALNILGHAVCLDELASAEQYRHQSITNEVQQRSTLHHDFNLEHWIQVIQNAEEESAQDEDFKEAKIYKELGDRLTGLYKFLVELENDKHQAVSAKDYDEADKIKADMVQVRQNAESLLKHSGIQITRDGDILPFDTMNSSSIYNSEEEDMMENAIPDLQSLDVSSPESKLNQSSSAHPDQLLDEAIANWTSFDALSINKNDEGSPSLLSATIPIQQTEKKVVVEKQIVDPETIPEPLSDDDIESCELPIEQFGQDLVACIMSVKVKCRQIGLNELSLLIGQKEDQDLEFIQASLLMIGEAVTDSRESIFNQAIQTWKELEDQLLEHSNSKILNWIEKFFTRVLIRTSDNNPGIKITATKSILELIETYTSLTPLCFKERMIRNMKDAKARIDLIMVIVKKTLIPRWKTDASFHRKDVMTFIASYLKNHPHADVRKSTWDLLVVVAQHQQGADFKAICAFLENDTVKLLSQELKKSEKKKTIMSSTSTTVNELRALAVKSNTSSKPAKKNDKKPASSTGSTKKAAAKTPKIIEEEDEEKTNVCIFCDEEDADFNEDTLISHYYNDCPVLTNCPMCQIVVEVSTMRDHLRKDCERKHLVKPCTHCRESIPVEQWLQHTQKKTCIATSPQQYRCPYCQKDMSKANETDWKSHLVSTCTKNPRMPK